MIMRMSHLLRFFFPFGSWDGYIIIVKQSGICLCVRVFIFFGNWICIFSSSFLSLLLCSFFFLKHFFA